MRAIGRYDGELQMFCSAPLEPDMSRLKFLRWMVEQRRLDHRVAGPSTGVLAYANGDIPAVVKPSEAEPKIIFKSVESNRTYYHDILEAVGGGEKKAQTTVPQVAEERGSRRISPYEYDTELKMVKEGPRDLDMGKLRFLRWLAERDKLEQS